jgi:hypothetical protein
MDAFAEALLCRVCWRCGSISASISTSRNSARSFSGVNMMAGFSALLAARLSARIGLINTMVFTHLPSNVLLMLVPLMPNATLAVIPHAGALQHFTDGCPDASVLYDGHRVTR